MYSVSIGQSIATELLVSSNGLGSNASSFPSSGTLCIPATCPIHVVAGGDTCASIASSARISTVQLMSWNPIVGMCQNLTKLVGQTLCLGNPAGDFAIVTNTIGSPTSVTTPAPAPTKVRDGTNSRCGRYYEIAAGDNCPTVSLKFSIALKDLYFLNPAIDANCTNLLLGISHCVQPVGTISMCPGYGGATATTPPFVPGPVTSLPWTGPIWAIADNATQPTGTIPIANKTRIDCWSYIFNKDTIKDIANASTRPAPLESLSPTF